MARVPVEQLAALGLRDNGGGGGGGALDSPGQAGSGASPPGRRLYPLLSILREEDSCAAVEPAPAPARPAGGAAVEKIAVAAAEGLGPGAGGLGAYPSMQPGTSPPASRQSQADVALAALRGAAAPGGGSGGGNRGAAAYHAWTLMQLAADAEGRRLLWEVRRWLGSVWVDTRSWLGRVWAGCMAGRTSQRTLSRALIASRLAPPLDQ